MAHGDLQLVGDLGGTQLRVGVAGPDFLRYDTVPTPADPDELFSRLGGMALIYVQRYAKDLPQIPTLGIGAPGPVVQAPEGSYVGPMTEIPGLDQVPVSIGQRLAAAHRRLKGLGILVLNDATAATYEAPHIEGLRYTDGSSIVTYYTHSTGIGGGNILAGDIIRGLMEPGKVPMLQPNGKRPYATLEELISGSAIQRRYGGGIRTAKELGRDPSARAAWQEIGQLFGRGIAQAAPLIGMGDVVIGGGVSRDHHLYEAALRAELDVAMGCVPAGVVETPRVTFVPGDQINDMGLRGAYQALLRQPSGGREVI